MILKLMQAIGPEPLPWKLPSWEQCTFDNKISKGVCNGRNIWVLLKSITLWFIWFEHNDLVFYMELWRKEKLQWLVCGGSS